VRRAYRGGRRAGASACSFGGCASPAACGIANAWTAQFAAAHVEFHPWSWLAAYHAARNMHVCHRTKPPDWVEDADWTAAMQRGWSHAAVKSVVDGAIDAFGAHRWAGTLRWHAATAMASEQPP
jgi:hypothetical protein